MKTSRKKRKIGSLEMLKPNKKKSFEEKCTICQYEVASKKDLMFLPCCHFYHQECIITWININITCPDCRIPIFINSFEQLNVYNKYKESQYNNPDLIRDNIQVNENTLSRMFMQEPTLFSLNEVDEQNYEKFYQLSQQPPYSLTERYRDLIAEYGEFSEDDNTPIFNIVRNPSSSRSRASPELIPPPEQTSSTSLVRSNLQRHRLTNELMREIRIRRRSQLHTLQWTIVRSAIDSVDTQIANTRSHIESTRAALENLNNQNINNQEEMTNQDNELEDITMDSLDGLNDDSISNLQDEEYPIRSNSRTSSIVIISRTSSSSSIVDLNRDISVHSTHIFFDSDDEMHISQNLTLDDIEHTRLPNRDRVVSIESASVESSSVESSSSESDDDDISESIVSTHLESNMSDDSNNNAQNIIRPDTPLPELPMQRTSRINLRRRNVITRSDRESTIPRIILNTSNNTIRSAENRSVGSSSTGNIRNNSQRTVETSVRRNIETGNI
ncbi:MAG: RING finger protein [Cetobacterium sp.]